MKRAREVASGGHHHGQNYLHGGVAIWARDERLSSRSREPVCYARPLGPSIGGGWNPHPSAEYLNCRKFLWSCISCRQYEGKNFVKPSCYVKSHFTFFTFLQRAIPSSPAGRFFFLNFGAPPSGASSIALPCSHSAGGFASPPSFSHGNLLYQPQKAHSSKVTSSIQCTPIA